MTVVAGVDARLVARRGAFVLDVALEVAPGETLAVVGPNAAGKSTIVAALAGLTPLADGHVRLAGRVLTDVADRIALPPEQRGIGIGFQVDTLFPHLTVRQNVGFGRAPAATVDRWLDHVGIRELADRRPTDLSGGQRQRVSLARALATDPDLLLLDEPLAAIDVAGRGELRTLLRDVLGNVDMPRIIVTHDPTDAFLLADRMVVVEAGTITNRGTVDEVRRRPRTTWAAELVGANLLRGTGRGDVVDVGDHALTIGTAATGEVLVTIPANAVALHLDQPTGSPRNTWRTRIRSMELVGEVARVDLGEPLRITVEVTAPTVADLHLAPGAEVWASVKATQVTTRPA